MPWLKWPALDHKGFRTFVRYFELKTLPTLVILGPDGKTLHTNAVELVESHGAEAYPFTPEKLLKLDKRKRVVKLEAQTLESILVAAKRDYVIKKNRSKVQVSELVGKNILLYFSAHWCPSWRALLPTLVEFYREIKSDDEAFEVIFISSDHERSYFKEFFSRMPWLALPFGDMRMESLRSKFKIEFIPTIIALGRCTVTHEAWKLIATYGPDAYPFTEEHVRFLEEELDRTAAWWPEKVKHRLHPQHELSRFRQVTYICDKCRMGGHGWAFCCDDCNIDLHPKCALKDRKRPKDVENRRDYWPGISKRRRLREAMSALRLE